MHQSRQDSINLTFATEINTYQRSLDGKMTRVQGERKKGEMYREEGENEKERICQSYISLEFAIRTNYAGYPNHSLSGTLHTTNPQTLPLPTPPPRRLFNLPPHLNIHSSLFPHPRKTLSKPPTQSPSATQLIISQSPQSNQEPEELDGSDDVVVEKHGSKYYHDVFEYATECKNQGGGFANLFDFVARQ
jgi:hypothetical protein